MVLLILATNTILSYMYYERIAIWRFYITPVVTFIGIFIAIGIASAAIPIVLLIIVIANVTH